MEVWERRWGYERVGLLLSLGAGRWIRAARWFGILKLRIDTHCTLTLGL